MSEGPIPTFWVGEETAAEKLWLYDPTENCWSTDDPTDYEVTVKLFAYHPTNPPKGELVCLDRADMRRRVKTVKNQAVCSRVIACYMKWREYQGFSYSERNASSGILDMSWAGGAPADRYRVDPVFYSDS